MPIILYYIALVVSSPLTGWRGPYDPTAVGPGLCYINIPGRKGIKWKQKQNWLQRQNKNKFKKTNSKLKTNNKTKTKTMANKTKTKADRRRNEKATKTSKNAGVSTSRFDYWSPESLYFGCFWWSVELPLLPRCVDISSPEREGSSSIGNRP